MGVQLFVPSLVQLKIEQAGRADPYALPTSPISSLMRFTPSRESGRLIHVRGVVTLRRPEAWAFVQDDSGGVVVNSKQKTPVKPGDLVDAIGFPTVGQYAPILQSGYLRKIGEHRLPSPLDLTMATTLSSDHDAELVKIDGTLLDQTRSGTYRILTMRLGSLTFTGRTEEETIDDRVRSIRSGSRLQMVGIWSIESDEYGRPTGYRVLLRSGADIVVLQPGRWWSAQRILALLAALGGVILSGSLWVVFLHRRVEEKTETLRAGTTRVHGRWGSRSVNSKGRVATFNQKFVEMWRIPEPPLPSWPRTATFSVPKGAVEGSGDLHRGDSSAFEDPEARSDDTLLFKDGRIFERHSEPQRVKGHCVGRVWGFRDVNRSAGELWMSWNERSTQPKRPTVPRASFWRI